MNTLFAAAALGLSLAHPLGNFSVNEYVGLVLHPDRVETTVVVDFAEIPTLQARPSVEAAGVVAYAAATCTDVADAVAVVVAGDRLVWTVTASAYDNAPGAGGLSVSRLECTLIAPAHLGSDGALSITNGYLADRVGWRELTARGAGVGLVDPPVPATSVSDELRHYPTDLLSSALDVRSATLRVTAGAGTGSVAPGALPTGGDPVSRVLSTLDRHFADLAGGPLTPAVVAGAVLLALLLGAGHAALPGHGKTVMAAYLAGRRGRPRDALVVAGTVTLTHTGGVLMLGLVITAGSAIAGERVLGWLGVVSGVVVLLVGAGMLRSVLRRRAHHHPNNHSHDHAYGHGHAHGHGHGHDHVHAHPVQNRWGLTGIGIAGGLVPSPTALVVLLAAIGLGRAVFGVLLVVLYGAGMAATLAGAGLLLVTVQRRLAGRVPRLRGIAARLSAATPAATATLVLVVGAGLAVRAAASVA